MFKPEAIIFDLDGVLIDTVEFHFAGWAAVAGELKVPFSREDNDRLRGIPRKKALKMLSQGLSGLSKESEEYLLDLKAQIYFSQVSEATDLILIQGVDRLLKELRSENILTGLASASRHAFILLEITDIAEMFDEVSDGNFPGQPKPSPEQLLFLSRKLNVEPENCVVVEDSVAGLEAAAQAGMHSVAIGDTCRQAGLTPLMLDSLSGVCAQKFLKLVGTIDSLKFSKEKI